jgi:hypothetical protein
LLFGHDDEERRQAFTVLSQLSVHKQSAVADCLAEIEASGFVKIA